MAKAVSPTCQEKIRLADQYHVATKAYSLAVGELYEKIGTTSKSDYLALRDAVARANEHASKARYRLERHIEEHYC